MDVHSKFNYYEILEVSPQSHQTEVNSAYEKMKLTYSGDNPAIYTIFSEEEARNMLNLIEEAFSILGNKSLRDEYDERMNFNAKGDSLKLAPAPKPNSSSSDKNKKGPLFKPEFKTNPSFEAEIKDRNDWDGEQLRKVREYKNWTLELLAETTKISGYYIQGIEKLEPSSLPAPVFVRGYVSQICRVLSLDEKKVCDSFMKHYKNALERK